MNAPGLSVVAIGSPVGVIRFHESPSSSLLIGFHLLLAMAVHLLMRLDVARNTQRFEVHWVVCQPLHILLGLGRLDGRFVVNIHSRCDVTIGQHTSRNALASAPLA